MAIVVPVNNLRDDISALQKESGVFPSHSHTLMTLKIRKKTCRVLLSSEHTCHPVRMTGTGPALSHNLSSDGEFLGRIRARKVPVEMVPTPDKILHKNRYF
jgi:hypothetical protein